MSKDIVISRETINCRPPQFILCASPSQHRAQIDSQQFTLSGAIQSSEWRNFREWCQFHCKRVEYTFAADTTYSSNNTSRLYVEFGSRTLAKWPCLLYTKVINTFDGHKSIDTRYSQWNGTSSFFPSFASTTWPFVDIFPYAIDGINTLDRDVQKKQNKNKSYV